MKRIVFRDNVPHLDSMPIPPSPYAVAEEAELVIRLRSTRTGANARWWAGEEARKALNGAPYCPVLRAVVSDFSWAPPDTRDCPSPFRFRLTMGYRGWEPEVARPDWVIQCGSGVVNWFARVVSPLPDPARDVVRAAWLKVSDCGCREDQQGHLTVYRTSEESVAYYLASYIREHYDYDAAVEEVDQALQWGSGNRWFYNHLVVGHRGFIHRVLDTEEGPMAVGLVRVGNRTCYILSPDHPDEPIKITGPALYVLVHPLPRRRGGVD